VMLGVAPKAFTTVSKALSQELRENCRYLRDGGWQHTASLMVAAANEFDRLEMRVKQLEERNGRPPRTVQDLVRGLVARRKS
jgi:hypothetical protein